MKTSIIYAFGCEIRDWNLHKEVIDFLAGVATEKSPGVYEYKKGKREFEIRIVYTKAEFGTALDKDDAIVVYNGHSRFGQGPAFGDSGLSHCPGVASYPINPWEDHFRMGYDAVEVPCIEEIFGHCTNPTEIPKTKLPKDFFVSGHVKKILAGAEGKTSNCKQKGFARRALSTCYPTAANKTNGRGVQSLKNRDFWLTSHGETEFHTIVEVGAKDLGKVHLKCGVLFMYSCLSRDHYYPALRRRKKEAKSKCIFYLTTRLAYDVPATKRFLELILKGVNPRTTKGSTKLLKRMNQLGLMAGRIIMSP